MTTPAQEKGFIENVTRLKLVGGEGDYSEHSRNAAWWVMHHDDGSSCPYFTNEDGMTLCAYVRDFEIIQEVPKFPEGSRVVVVASGWGLGPEHMGKELTIKGFTLQVDNHTIYTVVDETGQQFGGQIWEPSFELAPPPVIVPSLTNIGQVLPVPAATVAFDVDSPVLVPNAATANIPQYTPLQQKAINTFQAMYDDAVKYRDGDTSGRLNGDYGICDNIDRYASRHGSSESQMSEVKENLIRRTPSYSGNYTYPVPCPDGGDASNAFSRHSNKWRGAYGLNRLNQLGEMIELLKTVWDDNLIKRQTPAFRNGLKVGDLVRYTRRDEPSFWVFRNDDGSQSPSFHKLGNEQDYSDIDLNYIVKVDAAEVLKERAVSEFLSVIAEQEARKVDIEAQIVALQAQLKHVKNEVAILDYGLAQQHKVKRIA
jgi:hypothetical protein